MNGISSALATNPGTSFELVTSTPPGRVSEPYDAGFTIQNRMTYVFHRPLRKPWPFPAFLEKSGEPE